MGAGGRTVGVLWGVAARTCSGLLAALCAHSEVVTSIAIYHKSFICTQSKGFRMDLRLMEMNEVSIFPKASGHLLEGGWSFTSLQRCS